MATLSKVLSESDNAVQPVTWRTKRADPAAAPVRPARPSPAQAHPPQTPPPSADFEAQVQQQLEAAFAAGVREGETATRQKLEADVRQSVEQVGFAVAEVAASRANALRAAEADVVRLSIEIARRILHREITADPAALGALARAALDKLASQRVCRVRLHPDQEPVVRATLAQAGHASDVEIISDVAQPRGTAIFETDNGSLDASVDTQLREIERGLADRLQERA
jgi:flagellar assembly protein FliH